MNFCIKFDTKTNMSTSQNQINYDTLPPEIHDHIWKIVHGLNMYDVKKELKATWLFQSQKKQTTISLLPKTQPNVYSFADLYHMKIFNIDYIQ